MLVKINKKLLLEDGGIFDYLGNLGSGAKEAMQNDAHNFTKTMQHLPSAIKSHVSDSAEQAQANLDRINNEAAHKTLIGTQTFKDKQSIHDMYAGHLKNQHNAGDARLDNVNAGYSQALQNQHADFTKQLEAQKQQMADMQSNHDKSMIQMADKPAHQISNPEYENKIKALEAQHNANLVNQYNQSTDKKIDDAKAMLHSGLDTARTHVNDNFNNYALGLGALGAGYVGSRMTNRNNRGY